jgi:hypothetical protein
MSWVRYDDGFDCNPKVTAVIADDPAAIALHLLARTWTARQKHKGHVPAHQPGVLVADRALGASWAATLVRHDLWHERGFECADCRAETGGWPPSGYVIHHWWKYDPPARERVSAGTPAELSAKRAEAGRRGGLASAERRSSKRNARANTASASTGANGANQANAQANPSFASTFASASPEFASDLLPDGDAAQTADLGVEANGASKSSNTPSNRVSPVPVPVTTDASNEASVAAQERRRATRIPADFYPSASLIAWAKTTCPQVDGKRETEKFINYWTAKSGRDATKLDWDATWRNWILNAAERTGTPAATRSTTDERVAAMQALKQAPLAGPQAQAAIQGSIL